MKNVSAIQRGFIIRTFLLVLAVCGTSFGIACFNFESTTDLRVEFATLLISIVGGMGGGWLFILRPMGKMIEGEVEQRQRDFNERFTSIIDSMQEAMMVYDRKGVVHWNRAALKILEVTAEDMRRNHAANPEYKLVNESGSTLLPSERPTEQCFSSGIPTVGLVGLQRPTGRTSWLRVNTSPVFTKRSDEDRRKGNAPTVESVIATFRDITVEREATQRFELAMKAVKLGVWDFDFVTGTISWDEAMYELFEVDPSSNPVKRGYEFFESFIVPEDRERVKRMFELSVLECRDNSMEFRVKTGRGNIRAIRSESKGFYSRDGKPLRHVGVNWDITAHREQELRVIQASKMSTLGEMSAGIAHEINNPLAIILGKIEAMRTAMAAPALNRELLTRHVDTMERTANRIAKIVKGLRTFSRDGDQDPFEVTNVSEIVNEAVALCNSRFLNNGIELHVTNAPTDLFIDARAVQISQVLLNLLNNAFDAVGELEAKWVRLEVRLAGAMIEFSVTDSGAGIPEDVRAKMTQPFFTTKEVGMGTGLGLSIASGIVSAHGGTIEVDTISPNTRFVVRIPQVHEGATSVA